MTGFIEVGSPESQLTALERSRGTNLQFTIREVGVVWTSIDHNLGIDKGERERCCICLDESEEKTPLGHLPCSNFHYLHYHCFIGYAQFCHDNSKVLECPAGCSV